MVAKPPGGRPGMAGDELAPPVGTPAFPPLPAAFPGLSWLSTAALVAALPESLRPAEPGPQPTAPPGRGTPAPGLTAVPACLVTALCREAAPPAHACLICFVCCCMMSLLFVHTCYLLQAIPLPAFCASAAGCPYPIHSTNTRVLQAFPIQIAKRRDTPRSRAVSVVPPQETKWTHAPFSGHESRCCSFCNKRARIVRMWAENGAERSRLPLVRPSRSLLRAPPGTRPRRTTQGRVSRPGRTGCTSRRLTTVAVTVRCIRHRARRCAVTVVIAVGAVSSVGGGRGRCLSHCLFVVLQHLGHGCLHGSAGLLALLAQLAAQGQGGCPG